MGETVVKAVADKGYNETALMRLGYNLMRAINLLGFEKMMEAMA